MGSEGSNIQIEEVRSIREEILRPVPVPISKTVSFPVNAIASRILEVGSPRIIKS
ncbi:MAG: hypothetical protein ACXAC6_13980 [Candidatus Hodarchaeales archaeon]